MKIQTSQSEISILFSANKKASFLNSTNKKYLFKKSESKSFILNLTQYKLVILNFFRKSAQNGKSARWREPSPEKLETLERRQRDAANRTKRSRSRSEQSSSPKRQSRTVSPSVEEITVIFS